MALLEVVDLTFGYVDPPLFQGVTFRLEAGERAALVAPNGAGKSTVLRLLAGELTPDRGTVTLARDARLGYYRQSHELSAGGTLLEALLAGFGDLLALRRALTDAEHQAASGRPEDLEALGHAMERHHLAGADALERRVETIAGQLGFTSAQLHRPVASLSGGERGRVQLGSVLAQEPDVLLLDEPTNHLDLSSIRWLEGYLAAWKGAVLVVSHDRAFLDAACPSTMELGRTTFRSYPLPYTAYHAARAEDLERERRLAEEQAAFVSRTEDFIRKNIAGQKTKQAQSRRRMLEKLERVDRPEDVWARAERVAFRFVEAPRSGDIVLEASGLGAERGGRPLYSDLSLLVRRGDRVGIVGPNGSGKSTLLKQLAGRSAPPEGGADHGSVRRGTNLKEGYFDQHLGELDPRRSAVEEIRALKGDFTVDAARAYLARFRFWGDDPLRQVASLSGGERTRLSMAKLLLEPINLLFLDEPTNHLDIPAAEILEEALMGFPGTVILVSHDRRFLENVTTRTVAFTPSSKDRGDPSRPSAASVDTYEGGFADYTEAEERRERARRAESAPRAEPRRPGRADASGARPAPGAPAGADAAESRLGSPGTNQHRARRAEAREIERRRRRLGEVEAAIAASEAEVGALRARLSDAPGGNWAELHTWALQERELSTKLEALMAEWMTLSEQVNADAGGAP